jgi:hypothetical protein
MLGLCKRERGEKAIAKTSHRRGEEKKGIVGTSQRRKKASLELLKEEK